MKTKRKAMRQICEMDEDTGWPAVTIIRTLSDAPAPMRFISNGAPMQAATPILTELGSPRAAAMFATRSPDEFPMAITVNPSMDVDTPMRRPPASMSATSSAARRSSQMIVVRNPSTTIDVKKRGRASVVMRRCTTYENGEARRGASSSQGIHAARHSHAPTTPPQTFRVRRAATHGGFAAIHLHRLESHDASDGIDAHRMTLSGSSRQKRALDRRPPSVGQSI